MSEADSHDGIGFITDAGCPECGRAYASGPCECQAQPASDERAREDCGVIYCGECGMSHTEPECEPIGASQ